MNNKPISEAVLNDNNITKDFVDILSAKLVNPEHVNCALRMFIRGQLPMDYINNAEAIDLAAIRKQIADAIRERRTSIAKHVAETRRLSEYYATCRMLSTRGERGQHYVFIKDGHIVAFGAESGDRKQGGIYAAHNDVHGDFKWTPNEHLARIRRFDKAFYKRIKKAAFADDPAIFDMNHRTIVNHGGK